MPLGRARRGRPFFNMGRQLANNLTNANTTNFKAGINALKAGTRDCNILCIGDSLTSGQGSNGAINGLRPNSYPSVLAGLLGTRFSVTQSLNNFFGLQGITIANYPLYDTKFVNSSAIASSTVNSIGGPIVTATTDTPFMQFTPDTAFDQVDYMLVGRAGIQSLQATGGTGETLNTASIANGAVLAGTWNLASGNESILKVIGGGSGTGFGCSGLILRNSTLRRLCVLNGGWRGSTTVQWTPNPSGNAYDPYKMVNALQGIRPIDLILINIGTNDMASGTPSTYATQLNRLVGQVKLAGTDVIIVLPHRYQSVEEGSATHATAAMIDQYLQAMRDTASSNGIGWIDVPSQTGTYTQMNALGQMFDVTHPNQSGYARIAGLIDTALDAAYKV